MFIFTVINLVIMIGFRPVFRHHLHGGNRKHRYCGPDAKINFGDYPIVSVRRCSCMLSLRRKKTATMIIPEGTKIILLGSGVTVLMLRIPLLPCLVTESTMSEPSELQPFVHADVKSNAAWFSKLQPWNASQTSIPEKEPLVIAPVETYESPTLRDTAPPRYVPDQFSTHPSMKFGGVHPRSLE